MKNIRSANRIIMLGKEIADNFRVINIFKIRN